MSLLLRIIIIIKLTLVYNIKGTPVYKIKLIFINNIHLWYAYILLLLLLLLLNLHATTVLTIGCRSQSKK
jgi:hypothetical protein